MFNIYVNKYYLLLKLQDVLPVILIMNQGFCKSKGEKMKEEELKASITRAKECNLYGIVEQLEQELQKLSEEKE